MMTIVPPKDSAREHAKILRLRIRPTGLPLPIQTLSQLVHASKASSVSLMDCCHTSVPSIKHLGTDRV